MGEHHHVGLVQELPLCGELAAWDAVQLMAHVSADIRDLLGGPFPHQDHQWLPAFRVFSRALGGVEEEPQVPEDGYKHPCSDQGLHTRPAP